MSHKPWLVVRQSWCPLPLARLRAEFRDFDPHVEVRLLHGLGHMDGATRVLGGGYYLLFGLDHIATLHTWPDDTPFLVHELWHVYQDQRIGRDGRNVHLVESADDEKDEREQPLFVALWGEGLATYVSEWLCPGATREQILLEVPVGMAEACEANLAFLVADVRAKFDSHSNEYYKDYFTLHSADPRRPKRAGYYVGYRLAKQLHARRPMTELVMLDGAELREALSDELTALARGL